MTSINQIAKTAAHIDLETTVMIDEGALYIRHDSYDKRYDRLQQELQGFYLNEPVLERAWVVGLRMPGYTLDNYEHGDTLDEALAAILSRYGRCKAKQYLDDQPVRTSSPAADLHGLTDDEYMDAAISAIDGPTGRRF
jgi:hypothetical protein